MQGDILGFSALAVKPCVARSTGEEIINGNFGNKSNNPNSLRLRTYPIYTTCYRYLYTIRSGSQIIYGLEMLIILQL